MEILSLHGPVRFEVGGGPVPVGQNVALAPLNRQLYALVRPTSPLVAAIDAHGVGTLVAEDPQGEYLVRVRARAAVGRPVNGEARRAELMHWMPEDGRPQVTLTIRLHPEHVEYIRGKGAARERIAGPVPGGELPGGLARWLRLGREGVVVWYFVMLVLDWVGLLVLGVPEGTRVLVVALLVLGGGAMLAGTAILEQWAVHVRYREGMGAEADASLLLDGWVPPAEAPRVGGALIAGGLLLAVMLSLGGGWQLGVLLVLASGAPLFGLVYATRHLFRRTDVESR